MMDFRTFFCPMLVVYQAKRMRQAPWDAVGVAAAPRGAATYRVRRVFLPFLTPQYAQIQYKKVALVIFFKMPRARHGRSSLTVSIRRGGETLRRTHLPGLFHESLQLKRL